MAHYISTVGYIEEGRPVFESVSEINGSIVAWDDKVFGSLMSVAQHGNTVFVASCPQDLVGIGRQLPRLGRAMCLFERRFFESHFHQKTKLVGENITDE
jgi:hypothetical protein